MDKIHVHYFSEKRYFTRFFKKAKRRKKYVSLEDALFTVETVEHSESGCGQCGLRYDTIDISGQMFTSGAKRWHSYSADVSAYYIIRCFCDDQKETPSKEAELFLKAVIDRAEEPLYYRFLSKKSTRLTRKSHI
jgi:hypothetical protein